MCIPSTTKLYSKALLDYNRTNEYETHSTTEFRAIVGNRANGSCNNERRTFPSTVELPYRTLLDYPGIHVVEIRSMSLFGWLLWAGMREEEELSKTSNHGFNNEQLTYNFGHAGKFWFRYS